MVLNLEHIIYTKQIAHILATTGANAVLTDWALFVIRRNTVICFVIIYVLFTYFNQAWLYVMRRDTEQNCSHLAVAGQQWGGFWFGHTQGVIHRKVSLNI